jgi:outer membrane receptor protein involved in Fe transport
MGSAATALAGFAMGGLPGTATAQTSEVADELEQIVVTGSRIKRTDLTSSSPVAVVNSEEFRLSGTVNVEQLLNTLPQTIPGFDATSNNPGNGTASVNLRGLGTARTLVMVNGRRWMSFDTSGVVDLNTIPQALIERVDVVTGGAGAVYGSDALAGVVNFIFKDDFEGLELSTQGTMTSRGDGDKFDFNATWGGSFADGKGHATVFANYFNRDPLKQDDRKFSTFALDDGDPALGLDLDEFGLGGGFEAGGSSGIPGTRVLAPAVPFDSNGDGIIDGNDANLGRFGPNGEPLTFTAADRFNYAPDNFLQLPQERWEIAGLAHYEVNEALDLYTELTFVNNRVDAELAPTPFFETVDFSIDTPFLSQGSQDAFAALDDDNDNIVSAFFGRRLVEVGPRRNLDERNAMRVVTGIRGDLSEWLDTWSYDAYYMFSRTRNSQRQEGNVAISKMQQALLTETVGGELVCQDTSGGCVPINIFGEGNISEEAADFVRIGATNLEVAQTQVASLVFSGDTIDIGAGPWGLAFGAEWRAESAAFTPDEFLGSGDVSGFNAGQPTAGRYDVTEFFMEINAPVLADLPFAQSLNLTGALRISDYSTVGGVETYSGGVDWRPIDDLLLRGQYQRAVRAPNVDELFRGASQGFPGATDPCSDKFDPALQDANLRALCEATGVPAGLVFGDIQPNTQIEGVFRGNTELNEETSDTYTFGAVYSPSAVPGLNVTVDYYDIKVKDAIATAFGGANNLLRACYFVSQDASSQACSAITRISGGIIDTIDLPQDNTAALTTSGIDLQVDYNWDIGAGLISENSVVSIAFLGTWVEDNTVTPSQDFPDEKVFCAGQFGNTCGTPDPEFRANTRVSLYDGPLTLSLRWRWMDSVKDDQIVNDGVAVSDLVKPKIGSQNYFDLSTNYELTSNLTVFGGIDNLFDNKPPLVGTSQQQANTFPNAYNPLGATIFLGATVRF